MSDLTIHLDSKAEMHIERLKSYYNLQSNAAIIRKALSLLQFVSEAEINKAELVIKKDGKESTVHVRKG